jgi:adenylyltransferase/sulfurtransferase
MKYILGIGDMLINKMFIMNALTMEVRIVKFNRNKECRICGENPEIREIQEYEQIACEIKRN